MADITFPRSFAAAGVLTAAHVAENLFSPAGTPDSCDVLNGQLTEANIAAGTDIEREHVQAGAFSRASMVGATANLDYFADWFNGVPSNDRDDAFLPISGANMSFFLPYGASAVLFSWTAMWFGNMQALAEQAAVKLFINGTAVSGQRRFCGRTALAAPAALRSVDRARVRFWSGQFLKTGLTRGWHSAGLRIIHDTAKADNGQARVYVRSFRRVVLR